MEGKQTSFGVCRGAVFKWERYLRQLGVEGLQRKHPTWRPPEKEETGKEDDHPRSDEERSEALRLLEVVVRDIAKKI
jgi:hypothetical protein